VPSLSRRDLLIGGMLLMEPARQVMANEQSEAFTVLRLPFDAARPNELSQTQELVRILANAPTSPETLTAALATVSAASTAKFHVAEALSAVSIGPVLDSPDKVELQDFARIDNRLVLRIDYTRIRMTDITLPRNLPWRPMLVAPVPTGLTPGRYEVEAVWRAVSAIPGGHPLPVDDLRQGCHLEIAM
jgi:hypothetical protein